MLEVITVKGSDVRVGDSLYNKNARHEAFRWSRVNEIVPTLMSNGRNGVELHTLGYYTVVDEAEGVTVRRNNF